MVIIFLVMFLFIASHSKVTDIVCSHLSVLVFVSHKAKGRISKRVFQENKARQVPKNEHFLLLDTGGKK